jgi:hypothetical protein
MTTFTTEDREGAERKPMNANELADELEIVKNKIIGKEHELGGRAIIFYTEAATMLRQQQEKIDKLTAIVALREIEMEEMKKRNLFLESIYRTVKVQEK